MMTPRRSEAANGSRTATFRVLLTSENKPLKNKISDTFRITERDSPLSSLSRAKVILLTGFIASTAWPLGLLHNGQAISQAPLPEYHAYCQSDYFRVKCNQDEVILITHARYGRMRISRCVKENFGYIGCSVDVLEIMDSHCSGRRSCSVRILDDNFENLKPCHDDLKSYLEITYICVKVFAPDRNLCQNLKPVTIRNQTGYLASVISAETGCGTAESPWLIVLPPGQRINITLFDFATLNTNVSGTSATVATWNDRGWTGQTAPLDTGGEGHPVEAVAQLCRVYAIIREPNVARGVTICGGDTRSRTAYVSFESTVEIRLITGKALQNSIIFILRYEALGCPDVQAPYRGWIKREDNVALFGCSENREKWQLRCHGRTWVGERKNCSKAERFVNGGGDITSNISLPIGVSLIIIVTLALAVGLIILVVGIFCLKRIKNGVERDSTVHISTSTTCFTLNAGRSGERAIVSNDTKKTEAAADEINATETQSDSSLVNWIRGSSNKHQKLNPYGCMKLLRHGSLEGEQTTDPDSHFMEPEKPGLGNIAYLTNDRKNNYISRETPRNSIGNDMMTTRHDLSERCQEAHDLNPRLRCCHSFLDRVFSETDCQVRLNQNTWIGPSTQEMSLLCGEDVTSGCSAHNMIFSSTDLRIKKIAEMCETCQRNRFKEN